MPAPAWTYNAVGNILASTTITNPTPNTTAVDFSAVMAGQLQIEDIGGASVSTVNGLQVTVFRDFATNIDNVPAMQFVIATVASANEWQSIELPTGKYHIQLVNLDVSHTVNAVITSNTLSWPS